MKSIDELTTEAARTFMDKDRVAYMDEYALMDGFEAGAEWERKRDKWINVEDRPIELTDIEVIAYHPNWVDEDFNPKGTRIGFINEGKFISSRWCDYQDCYISEDTFFPTHYMLIPKPPKQNS